MAVGVYGVRVALDTRLSNGDRVEIYRPLQADPKDLRRRRAIRRGAD
jgi:putative ubiquitin-RnfH superfamily antitoxin RatB of RatAB toxin-antitoxin module